MQLALKTRSRIDPDMIVPESFTYEQLPDIPEYAELPEAVAEHVIHNSRLSITPGPWTSRSRIHRGYDKASRMLADLRKETPKFITAIIDGGMQFEGFEAHPHSVQNSARHALRDIASEFFAFRHKITPNIKTLELLGESKAKLAEVYAQDITNQATQYVTELFPFLDELRHKGILGRIRYSGERSESAEFTFFRSKAIIEGVRKSKRKIKQKKGNDSVISTHEVRHSGEIQLRHAWHTHLLSDVSVIPAHSWKLPLPTRIKQILDSIPSVLYPATRIVSGTVEFIRIVEMDVDTIPFEYRDTYVTEERVRHHDPAIVIGNWVVAGWCEAENPKTSLTGRLVANCLHRLHRVTP